MNTNHWGEMPVYYHIISATLNKLMYRVLDRFRYEWLGAWSVKLFFGFCRKTSGEFSETYKTVKTQQRVVTSEMKTHRIAILWNHFRGF